MLTVQELLEHYRGLPESFLDVLVEIHNLVAWVNPYAVEEIRRQGVVYYDGQRGGPVKAGICQLLFKENQIHVAFIHGALLPDPQHLLEGKTYPKRFIRVRSYESAPWDAIRAFITIHNALDVGDLQTRVEKLQKLSQHGF